MIEVATVQLWCFSGHGGNLQANLLSLASGFDGFVVDFNVCHYADVQKLQGRDLNNPVIIAGLAFLTSLLGY